MRKLTLLSIILTTFCLSNCSTGNADKILNPELQKTMNQLVEENQIPGLNFSVIYKDGKQENYSAGYSNLEKKVLLKSDDVLFSGSIGKTYAVAVLMQLIEEGKLNLSDKLINYFPETKWLSQIPNLQDITIEMLLQHTSGLPRYVMKEELWDSLYVNPDKIWTYKDRLSLIFGDEPVHEAGKGWSYSDTNYILIGMLIEKLTGSDYYNVVKERIFIPENLNETHASLRRDIPHLTIGYSHLPEEFKMPEIVVVDGFYAFNPQMEWTGGGMASTTSDLAKWAKIYYEGKLFSDSLRLKIITPNSNAEMTVDSLAYGMGSFIYATKNGILYGHTGFVPGFNSIFAYDPEEKIAMALQTNCDFASQKMGLIDYLDLILTKIK